MNSSNTMNKKTRRILVLCESVYIASHDNAAPSYLKRVILSVRYSIVSAKLTVEAK
jgi:hypothetical protein